MAQSVSVFISSVKRRSGNIVCGPLCPSQELRSIREGSCGMGVIQVPHVVLISFGSRLLGVPLTKLVSVPC